LLVKASAGRHDEAPDALLMVKGGLRDCPAVTGTSRVTVSDACRSHRPKDGRPSPSVPRRVPGQRPHRAGQDRTGQRRAVGITGTALSR
jgi:hypothetical protein